MKKLGLAVAVVLAVFIGVTGIVKSAEDRELARACMQREQSEKAFMSEVRSILTESGYENCGINLSRVGDMENGWEYTVRIHHRKLLDDIEKCENLSGRIEEISRWDSCESVSVEFF